MEPVFLVKKTFEIEPHALCATTPSTGKNTRTKSRAKAPR